MKKENKHKSEINNNDMENKHKFSDKVKFHPWVGDKYEYGIKGFDENDIIKYGTKDKQTPRRVLSQQPSTSLPFWDLRVLSPKYCLSFISKKNSKWNGSSRINKAYGPMP